MTESRHFVLLQGPHGPFFRQLAHALLDAGADVTRVCFNGGDSAFAGRRETLLRWTDGEEGWSQGVHSLLADIGATDVVAYGETRPRHQAALDAAKDLGLRTHRLEEGYLRPFWVTYERDGCNAASPAAQMSIADIRARLSDDEHRSPKNSDGWGNLPSHVFWGAAYHAALLLRQKKFPKYVSHRDGDVRSELLRYSKRLMTMPLRRWQRRIATHHLLRQGRPFHVVLLQLAHDANFRDHGVFPNQQSFLETVIRGFAESAPKHHQLVIKSHPLEDGRYPLIDLSKSLGRRHGVADRIVFIDGGKLAHLLNDATSAITVNSTAGEQVLWRGLPLRAFGQAVYQKTELVCNQSLRDFFANPRTPDTAAYQDYRRFLLETSQLPGGYYSERARRKLLRRLPDLLLEDIDRYAARPVPMRRVSNTL